MFTITMLTLRLTNVTDKKITGLPEQLLLLALEIMIFSVHLFPKFFQNSYSKNSIIAVMCSSSNYYPFIEK